MTNRPGRRRVQALLLTVLIFGGTVLTVRWQQGTSSFESRQGRYLDAALLAIEKLDVLAVQVASPVAPADVMPPTGPR